jgi:hypothetical protein
LLLLLTALAKRLHVLIGADDLRRRTGPVGVIVNRLVDVELVGCLGEGRGEVADERSDALGLAKAKSRCIWVRIDTKSTLSGLP